jgi:hypothetical protein
MPLPASIPLVILDTVLDRLALLFLAGACGDMAAARAAARALLAAYDVQSETELTLAADVISFSFHSLEALSQALTADMPLNKVIRLRGSAVSLNREAHRSRQKLEQLQHDRRAGLSQPQAEAPAPKAARAPIPERACEWRREPVPQPTGAPSRAEQAADLVDIAREAITIAEGGRKSGKKPGKYGGLTYAQMLQKRMAAQRIAENLKRKAAADLARMRKSSADTAAGEPVMATA